MLYLAAFMLFAVFLAASLMYLRHTLPKADTSPLQLQTGNDKGFLIQSAGGHFGAQSCSYANGLAYIVTKEGLFEADLSLGKYTCILDTGRSLSCISPYGGYIYAVDTEVVFGKSVFESYERTHIVKIDYNTKEKAILYTSQNGRQICDMAVSFEGDIFFTERDIYESGDLIPKNSVIYKMTDSTSPEKVTDADFYYIYNKRLYLTKYDPETDSERLFIAKLDSPDEQTDTGINVGREISLAYTPMFCPSGDSVYYTDESFSLCRYDIKSGNSERVFGFDDESRRIYYYGFFDERIVLLVREQLPDESWCYELYCLDEMNRAVKITGDRELNEGRRYMFEYTESINIFPGCDEYFLMMTYNQDIESRVYLIDGQMDIELILQSGEWDYDKFEKMRDSIMG